MIAVRPPPCLIHANTASQGLGPAPSGLCQLLISGEAVKYASKVLMSVGTRKVIPRLSELQFRSRAECNSISQCLQVKHKCWPSYKVTLQEEVNALFSASPGGKANLIKKIIM